MKWLLSGFSCLGILVGIVSGLSRTPIVTTFLTIIITFAGGSIIAILRSRDPEQLKIIGKALVFFSTATLVGVFIGIFLRQSDGTPIPPGLPGT
jgi:hypothetical protein